MKEIMRATTRPDDKKKVEHEKDHLLINNDVKSFKFGTSLTYMMFAMYFPSFRIVGTPRKGENDLQKARPHTLSSERRPSTHRCSVRSTVYTFTLRTRVAWRVFSNQPQMASTTSLVHK
jgi:hypothetical protein